MRRWMIAVFSLAGTASPAAAQGIVTHDEQVARCVAEEQQRDRLALRRYGQRMRDERALRDQCNAEVTRAFDDRVLGRTPPAPAMPVDRSWSARGTGTLVIEGSWHHVGVETGPDNRYAYFIDTNHAEQGIVAAAWLTSVYERTYPDGAASTAYRVQIDCTSGRWRYGQEVIRDAGFRVLRAKPPEHDWRMPVPNQASPIARVSAMLCRGASPGTPLPAEMPAPGDWARRWFAQHPR